MQRYCLTLNLRNDPDLIAEYIRLHRDGRPAVNQSIRDAGVLDMQIYNLAGRLFMIMDTVDDFSFENKERMDKANPAVQEWENLMAKYQDVEDGSNPSSGWQRMEQIYKLP